METTHRLGAGLFGISGPSWSDGCPKKNDQKKFSTKKFSKSRPLFATDDLWRVPKMNARRRDKPSPFALFLRLWFSKISIETRRSMSWLIGCAKDWMNAYKTLRERTGGKDMYVAGGGRQFCLASAGRGINLQNYRYNSFTAVASLWWTRRLRYVIHIFTSATTRPVSGLG